MLFGMNIETLNIRDNWRSYNYEKYDLPKDTLPGQLLLYPIQVTECCQNIIFIVM